jgi:hypothetical protein
MNDGHFIHLLNKEVLHEKHGKLHLTILKRRASIMDFAVIHIRLHAKSVLLLKPN